MGLIDATGNPAGAQVFEATHEEGPLIHPLLDRTEGAKRRSINAASANPLRAREKPDFLTFSGRFRACQNS